MNSPYRLRLERRGRRYTPPSRIPLDNAEAESRPRQCATSNERKRGLHSRAPGRLRPLGSKQS